MNEYTLIFEKVTAILKEVSRNKKLFKQIYGDTKEVLVDAYNFEQEKAEEITEFAQDKAADVEQIALMCMEVVAKLANPTESRALAKPLKECMSEEDLINRVISQLPPMEFENTLADVPRY